MKKVLLVFLLVIGVVYAGDKCQNRTVENMLKQITGKMADATVDKLVQFGETGAKLACQGAYQLGCNSIITTSSGGTGALICGGTGASVIRAACKTGISLASKQLQKANSHKKEKAKKAIKDFLYKNASTNARKVCKAVNRAIEDGNDRLKNDRQLTVINHTGHNVKFTVDIKGAPDSFSKEEGGHTGVIGNLPHRPKTFRVKAKIVVHPWEKPEIDINNVDPDRYKVELYEKDGHFHLRKIRK